MLTRTHTCYVYTCTHTLSFTYIYTYLMCNPTQRLIHEWYNDTYHVSAVTLRVWNSYVCHGCVWLGDRVITETQTLSYILSGRWNAFCRCTGGRSYQEKSQCHLNVPISQGIIELYIYTHIYNGTYTYIYMIMHTPWHTQICTCVFIHIWVVLYIYILWIRPNWLSYKGSKPLFPVMKEN